MDFSQTHTLSFDCYGTLIDWETGILACLRPWLARHGRTVADDTLLALYGELESAAEHGPFQPYKDILADVMRALAARLDVPLGEGEAHLLASSVGDWPAFPDTVAALRRLSARFDLVILSNVDEDLIAQTLRHLEVRFQGILTAERIGSYKPSRRNFEALIAHMAGREAGLLHCAQSRFHDIGPAKDMGLRTVWVDRRHDKPGEGATPPSAALPDARVTSLAGLAEMLLG